MKRTPPYPPRQKALVQRANQPFLVQAFHNKQQEPIKYWFSCLIYLVHMKILITSYVLLISMSFIKALMNFLRKLFGGSTTTTVQQTVTLDNSKCMKEDVIDFLANGHDQEERARIRAYIKQQESKGIYEYSFSTSRWYFEVKNGQFKSSNNPEDMKKNRI